MSLKDQWIKITAPYLDRHNDCLQIYFKKNLHGFLLTDDGYIIDDLMSSGCGLNTPRRQEMLMTILNGFGVYLDEKKK